MTDPNALKDLAFALNEYVGRVGELDDDEGTWRLSLHAIQVNLIDAAAKAREMAEIFDEVYGDEDHPTDRAHWKQGQEPIVIRMGDEESFFTNTQELRMMMTDPQLSQDERAEARKRLIQMGERVDADAQPCRASHVDKSLAQAMHEEEMGGRDIPFNRDSMEPDVGPEGDA